ncbi:MAG TPA: CapA family protein [Clostridia bacterium]|nr:CapA family protein [Clostridia bacterium]
MSERTEITILGDVCPAWAWRERFIESDIQGLLGDVLPALQESDLVLCNLECPVTEYIKPAVKTGPNLSCKRSDLELLMKAGVNAVSLANNHIRDFGDEGCLDTITLCDELKLPHFGAGANEHDAARPFFFEKNGVRIGFLSFAEKEFNCVGESCAGARLFSPYDSFDAIRNAKENCRFLVVLYHGGIENYEYPSEELRRRCRKMAESGADLVLCQHSHCVGSMERCKNGKILYGQGNFLFGHSDTSTMWNYGLMVKLSIGKDVELKLIGVEAKKEGLQLSNEDVVRGLEQRSERLEDEAFLKSEWLKFCRHKRDEYLPSIYGMGRVLNKLNRMTHGAVVKLLIGRRQEMLAMNLVRCDAHREVLTTIFEDSQER